MVIYASNYNEKMKLVQHRQLPIITLFATLLVLIWLTILDPPGIGSLGLTFVFLILIVFTSVFSAPLEGGMASLTPLVTVSSFLLIGLIPSAWIAFLGTVIYSFVRDRYSKYLGIQREVNKRLFISLTAANTTAKTTSILVGGAIYQFAGGDNPLVNLTNDLYLPLVLLGLGYFAINDLVFGSYIAAWEARSFHQTRRLVYRSIVFEGIPLIFSPILALIYTNLSSIVFIIACFAVMAISVITRNLAFASQRFERQVKELQSLQVVGQVLSSTLDLQTLLMAIYKHVSEIMPAELFYIALFDQEDNEIIHPLTMKDGVPVDWSSEFNNNKLELQILQTQKPTLSQESTVTLQNELKLSKKNRKATSWLGVPMMAGDELVGTIIVQSFSVYDLYDQKHQEILMTIASQAAVAIQNAGLYERTDEALRNRVQEMDSILRTIDEGVLLIDKNLNILTANKAFASGMGVHRTEIVGVSLLDTSSRKNTSLLETIGYSSADILDDCSAIITGEFEYKSRIFSIEMPTEKRYERTLTPVRDFDGNLSAWLLVIRDVTEEFEVTRLREDMMHTLVHDLRSPLAVVKGSLEVIRFSDDDTKKENIDELLRLALIGTERMLRLINNLLDVSRLEDGKMNVAPDWISIEPLINNAIKQVSPEANRVDISLDTVIEDDLPPIYIDQAHFERILYNLLDNAIKFTPDGGHITLSARLDPDFSPASAVIGVGDTGPGIPVNIQEQIFKKYKQIKTSQGRRTGSGVGLYYCKLAVEAQGGHIWVESDVGQGSTFYFRLPLAP